MVIAITVQPLGLQLQMGDHAELRFEDEVVASRSTCENVILSTPAGSKGSDGMPMIELHHAGAASIIRIDRFVARRDAADGCGTSIGVGGAEFLSKSRLLFVSRWSASRRLRNTAP